MCVLELLAAAVAHWPSMRATVARSHNQLDQFRTEAPHSQPPCCFCWRGTACKTHAILRLRGKWREGCHGHNVTAARRKSRRCRRFSGWNVRVPAVATRIYPRRPAPRRAVLGVYAVSDGRLLRKHTHRRSLVSSRGLSRKRTPRRSLGSGVRGRLFLLLLAASQITELAHGVALAKPFLWHLALRRFATVTHCHEPVRKQQDR